MAQAWGAGESVRHSFLHPNPFPIPSLHCSSRIHRINHLEHSNQYETIAMRDGGITP
jgi:hypothetical protein